MLLSMLRMSEKQTTNNRTTTMVAKKKETKEPAHIANEATATKAQKIAATTAPPITLGIQTKIRTQNMACVKI